MSNFIKVKLGSQANIQFDIAYYYITEFEVYEMIQNLDTNKSSGLDEIGSKFLKLSADKIAPH